MLNPKTSLVWGIAKPGRLGLVLPYGGFLPTSNALRNRRVAPRLPAPPVDLSPFG